MASCVQYDYYDRIRVNTHEVINNHVSINTYIIRVTSSDLALPFVEILNITINGCFIHSFDLDVCSTGLFRIDFSFFFIQTFAFNKYEYDNGTLQFNQIKYRPKKCECIWLQVYLWSILFSIVLLWNWCNEDYGLSHTRSYNWLNSVLLLKSPNKKQYRPQSNGKIEAPTMARCLFHLFFFLSLPFDFTIPLAFARFFAVFSVIIVVVVVRSPRHPNINRL